MSQEHVITAEKGDELLKVLQCLYREMVITQGLKTSDLMVKRTQKCIDIVIGKDRL